MNFFTKIFQTVTEAFKNCLKRFPVTVCFVFALTAYAIYLVANEPKDSQLVYTLAFYLPVGTLLSLTLHLWGEEIAHLKTKLIIHAIGHIALMADALYLYSANFDDYHTEIIFAHAAGILTIGLSTFFLSFFREKNDIASWNFALQSIYTFMVSNFIGWVMCGGICLLIASLDALFNVNVHSHCYHYTAIITCIWLPLMLFIGLLPQGEEKHNPIPSDNGFLNGIMHYLFLPLTIAYLIVLYVYATQILIHWELPKGWVSWLVIAIMAVCLILEFGLYPSRIKNRKKWDLLLARWLPLLILPLLLLMTIGIVRRFNDYGVTINRLYLITLNGWFYFICIGLFINKGKRINWIPISFALLFLLTSIFPINFVSYTRKKIYGEIEALIKTTCKEKLPMDKEAYSDWLKQLPQEQVSLIQSKMSYLYYWFGKSSLTSVTTDYSPLDYIEGLTSDTIATDTASTSPTSNTVPEVQNMTYKCYTPSVSVPQGYSKVYMITNSVNYYPLHTLRCDTISFKLEFYKDGGIISDMIYLDRKTLVALNNTNASDLMECRCKSDKHKFYLSHFETKVSDNKQVTLTISGFLFKN